MHGAIISCRIRYGQQLNNGLRNQNEAHSLIWHSPLAKYCRSTGVVMTKGQTESFQTENTLNFSISPSCCQNVSTHPITLHRPALDQPSQHTQVWCWNTSNTTIRDGWTCWCTDIQSSSCYEMMSCESGEESQSHNDQLKLRARFLRFKWFCSSVRNGGDTEREVERQIIPPFKSYRKYCDYEMRTYCCQWCCNYLLEILHIRNTVIALTFCGGSTMQNKVVTIRHQDLLLSVECKWFVLGMLAAWLEGGQCWLVDQSVYHLVHSKYLDSLDESNESPDFPSSTTSSFMFSCSEWNVLSTIKWIIMEFGADIHVTCKTNDIHSLPLASL